MNKSKSEHPSLQMFVERFKRFNHFETFQSHFAKLGILCYIVPDWYKDDYSNLAWRGIMEWRDEKDEWQSDDCGSPQNLDECRTSLIRMVLDHCLSQNINFLQ